MSDMVAQALEAVHAALNANNQGLDSAIAQLRAALAAKGEKAVQMQRERLPQNNRQGRKMLQTYFRKRGVEVTFDESEHRSTSQP